MGPAARRSQKIESLYRAARERDPELRAAFLDEACAGDEGLRGEIESLLRAEETGAAGSGDVQAAPAIASRRFKILRRIGAGGMGVVYEAWDRERNIRTALKTLGGFDPEALYLFKNEFRSLADVSHPHLVALYELFADEGQWFFSMEYVEGTHFLEYVRQSAARGPDEPTLLLPGQDTQTIQAVDGPLQAEACCDTAKLRSALGQLMRAVSALHAAGILHRDLKPANVKVTPEGRVVVLDFGLAEHQRAGYGQGTNRGTLAGTVPYMSPEQFSGAAATQAADWYAVGVMLYEALTTRRPFEGSMSRIAADKQKYDPPPASEFVSGIPEDLAEICGGLLERDAGRRMTGEQAMARLEWQGQEPAVAVSWPDQPHHPEQIFVGRDAELGLLRAAFAATERGAAAMAFVHGPSGIGKSTLVNHFLAELDARGGTVILAGRCYEQESMPYKALDSAVDALSRYLGRISRHEAGELAPREAAALTQIFPVLRRVEAIAAAPQRPQQGYDQHELRRRAFGALRELLARLGDRRRVVLYIDDLQWGDSDSATVLREVLRAPDAPALLLIGSWRDGYEGRSAFLDAMNREPPGDASTLRNDIPLGPLSSEETRELAARLAGTAAEAVARESEGNPYMLEELAAGAASGNTLDTVLRKRVAALAEDSRRLMEIVAVSGGPLGRSEAWKAAGILLEDPKVLTSLRAARLIGEAGAEIECYHDRVRETIVANLEPHRLRECHARLAAVLASSQGDAETIAIHFEGAGARERASQYYAIAAESASVALAFRHAADLYQRTFDLSSAEGEERRQLVLQLARALANAGRGQEAALTYGRALEGAPENEVFELRRKIAYWHSVSGHVDEGRAALEDMLRRVGLRTPSPRLLLPAMLLSAIRLRFHDLRFETRSEDRIPRQTIERLDAIWDATCSFGMIDVPVGIYLTGRHLLLALKAGEPMRVARALMLATVGAAGLPFIGHARVHRMMRLLEKVAEEAGTPYSRAAVLFARSFIDYCIGGRWRTGVNQLREAEEIFARYSGLAWEISTAHIFGLWGLAFTGQYAELGRLCTAYVHDARERGDLYEETSIGAATQPLAQMVAGRPDQALETMDEALGKCTRETYTAQHATSAYIRAWILLYRGEGAQALAFLEREWPKLRKYLYDRLGALGPWLHYARGESALAAMGQAGNQRNLFRVAERTINRLERDQSHYARSLADLIRAGCMARRGDLTSAAQLLESVGERLEEQDMAMFAAAARWRLGEIVGGERGGEWMAAAESAMKAQGVKEPACLADAFVNGFPRAKPGWRRTPGRTD